MHVLVAGEWSDSHPDSSSSWSISKALSDFLNYTGSEGVAGMNGDVEGYFVKQKSPQREILQKINTIVLKSLPEIEQKMWMGVPWYGEKFYVVGLKDHVNLGFSVKGLSVQEMALFEGKGKLMRHIKFYSQEDVDEARVMKLLRLVSEKGQSC